MYQIPHLDAFSITTYSGAAWLLRLTVRTAAFQAVNRGSIPLGATNKALHQTVGYFVGNFWMESKGIQGSERIHFPETPVADECRGCR